MGVTVITSIYGEYDTLVQPPAQSIDPARGQWSRGVGMSSPRQGPVDPRLLRLARPALPGVAAQVVLGGLGALADALTGQAVEAATHAYALVFRICLRHFHTFLHGIECPSALLQYMRVDHRR